MEGKHMFPILGIIIGILIGVFFIPVNIPQQYSIYMAVAILAALDSVFGGVASNVQGKFDMKIFVSGFFGNAILAAILAYIGDQLGLRYTWRRFCVWQQDIPNFAIIRRYLLNKSGKR